MAGEGPGQDRQEMHGFSSSMLHPAAPGECELPAQGEALLGYPLVTADELGSKAQGGVGPCSFSVLSGLQEGSAGAGFVTYSSAGVQPLSVWHSWGQHTP